MCSVTFLIILIVPGIDLNHFTVLLSETVLYQYSDVLDNLLVISCAEMLSKGELIVEFCHSIYPCIALYCIVLMG